MLLYFSVLEKRVILHGDTTALRKMIKFIRDISLITSLIIEPFDSIENTLSDQFPDREHPALTIFCTKQYIPTKRYRRLLFFILKVLPK